MNGSLHPFASPSTRDSLPHGVTFVLVLIVAVAFVRFGMEMALLARRSEMRDFAAVYTAAVVARAGAPFYDPRPDQPWFFTNENPHLIAAAKRLGTFHRHDEGEHVHIFSYPPAMMLLLLPIAYVPFPVARIGWLALSLLAIGCSMWLVGRTIGSRSLTTLYMLFLALTFHPIRNTLDLGQVNSFIFLLLAAFFAFYRGGRDVPAGVILGVATAIRFHPGLVILYLLWRRDLRVALVALVTAGGLTLLAATLFGVDQSAIYFTEVAPKFSTALISVENHSLAGFLATVGRGLGWTSGHWPTSSPWTARVAAVLVLATTATLLSRSIPPRQSSIADLEFGLILVMVSLAVPNSTINHLVTILPSFWILLDNLLAEENPRKTLVPYLVGTAAILIGVVDDFYMHPLFGHGLPILAAEIKPYGLILLFIALVLQRNQGRESLALKALATPGSG